VTLPRLPANLSAPPRLNAVSQLLQSPGAPLPFQPPSPTPAFSPPDQLSLQAPQQLFQARLPQVSLPPLAPSRPASGPASVSLAPIQQSPAEQLRQLGQKYGVVQQQGQSLNQFQTQVIKTIIRHKALEYGIPERIALGIAGNESGWKMWSNLDSAQSMQGRNVRDGVLKSTDWGAMQINDKAHPSAFPRAKQDLEYNIDYGLRYLARQRSRIQGSLGLGLGDWDRTVASYNLGHNPSTANALSIAQRYVGKVAQRAAQA